jgi:hypothetical protein
MENYYYNLANLPESYDKEQVVKFLGKHNILACEVGNAPRNKHIGSGAWHDDVLAFLIENFQQELVMGTEEDFKESVDLVNPAQPSEEELKELSEFIDSEETTTPFVNTMPTFTVESKKKASKKVKETPNTPTENGAS